MTTKDETTRKQCAGRVAGSRVYAPRHCFHPAKLHEGGKDWCGTHAPSKEAARRAKSNARHEQKRAALELRQSITQQERRVLDAAMAWVEWGESACPGFAAGVVLYDNAMALRALYAQRDQPEEGTP